MLSFTKLLMNSSEMGRLPSPLPVVLRAAKSARTAATAQGYLPMRTPRREEGIGAGPSARDGWLLLKPSGAVVARGMRIHPRAICPRENFSAECLFGHWWQENNKDAGSPRPCCTSDILLMRITAPYSRSTLPSSCRNHPRRPSPSPPGRRLLSRSRKYSLRGLCLWSPGQDLGGREGSCIR